MTKQYYYKSTVEKEFGCRNDIDKLSSILSEKGLMVYSISQKSNQLIPYHEHPSEEMVIVLSGSIRYVIEEEIVDLEEGDVIKVAPHSVHSMVGLAEDGQSKLFLTFV